ncbi:MAG TPA: DUF4410 domain-containing protein [Candidatus Acidoferrum sp.]|nr:DUF4410 domain-containing protein [Candidatus Acidoferrum sp.]
MKLIGCALSLFAFLSMPAPSHGQQSTTPPPQKTPFVFSKADMTVYVSDFDLDAQNFQADQGRTKVVQRPGIIEGPRKREQDPAVQAKKTVDEMATNIVNDLKKAGYKAERIGTTDAKPSTGVWVHGVFTELDEGNRIHRAVIGFGAGEAKMDLYVTMNDLSHPEQPLYSTAESGDSGKKPGAAITMNPYVAAAKFVMEKNAPEKTVKKTASEISDDIIKHLKEHEAR